MRVMVVSFCIALVAAAATAREADLTLAAPPAVRDSGLLAYILPRFSLKTGIRVIEDPQGAMVLADAPPGAPVFRDGETVYHLRVPETDEAARFRDWLLSDVGRRTIESFDGGFGTDLGKSERVAAPVFEGDAEHGKRLSQALCGRCHVIDASQRMGGIDSTPSFPVLRTLPDWAGRFERFYVLAPHGAFTQVAGVTPPFDEERPPSIVPVEMSLEDLDAIMAYVAATPAADLGAPLHLQ